MFEITGVLMRLHHHHTWGQVLGGLTLLVLAACSSAPPPEAPAESTARPAAETTATAPAPEPSTPTANAPEKQESLEQLKFKREDGSEAFSIKFKADGAKLVDADDQEIARFTVDDTGKVKIKDPSDQVLGFIVPEAGYWKVEDASQTQELFVLRHQDDGDYKLEDGQDTQIYRIKQRDYGFEVETPDKTSLYKVKLKGDKLSLRNANDATVISTKAPMVPAAMACFGLEALSLEQQAALAYAVNLSGGQ
jgi:hypothetical protein